MGPLHRSFNKLAAIPARAALLCVAAGGLAACDAATMQSLGAPPTRALTSGEVRTSISNGVIQVQVPGNRTLMGADLYLPDGTLVRAESIGVDPNAPPSNTIHEPGILTPAGDEADRPPPPVGDEPTMATIRVPDPGAYAQEWSKAHIDITVGSWMSTQNLAIPAPNPNS